jgi:hypothetical protein
MIAKVMIDTIFFILPHYYYSYVEPELSSRQFS